MTTTSLRTSILVALVMTVAAAARADSKLPCTEHPLFPTHMPNYHVVDCKLAEFDGYGFFLPKGKTHREEGKLTFITYRIDKGQEEASGIAVVRNYENAITKLGGTIVEREPNRWVNGKLAVEGKEVWFQAEKGNGLIWLHIIEKGAMEQHVVADAAVFSKGLEATGHVAVEGIFFDTGKAIVKPESTPALEQVAKLLKDNATLKLWVVGHTDSVGSLDDNVKLAQARAEAVVKALTGAHGVAPARLKGYGSGPLAPVASNDTEEGRAKNRRVELVKQP